MKNHAFMRIFVHSFTIILMFTSCKRNGELVSNEIQQICVSQKDIKPVLLSEIFNSINHIQLETGANCLLSRIRHFAVTDKMIIVVDNKISIFNKTGEFINSIGRTGKGPGEYLSINDVFIDHVKETIEIADGRGRKNILYSFSGEFISEWHHGHYVESFTKLDDDIYVIFQGNIITDSSHYKLKFINKSNNKIISKYFPVDENMSRYLHLIDRTNFVKTDNNIYFFHYPDNTIYSINSVDNIKPRIDITFADQMEIPADFFNRKFNDMYEFVMEFRKTGYAGLIVRYFETSKIISFTFERNNSMFTTYYSKESDSLIAVKEYIDDLVFIGTQQESSYKTVPVATYRNEFYYIIEAIDFFDRFETIKSRMSEEQWSEYSETHSDLVNLSTQINIDDNPILLIGTIKEF